MREYRLPPSFSSRFSVPLYVLLLTLAMLTAGFTLPATASADLVIRFDAPASDWEQEGLPFGNGAMGAVVMGKVQRDQLQFNEKTLWTGGPGAQGGYDFGWPEKSQVSALRKVQKTLAKEGAMSPDDAAAALGRKITGYGDYQSFGQLEFDFGETGEVSHYRRELDLQNAVVRVTYRAGGVNYTREYFASYPDQVIAVRFSADQPGKIHVSTGFGAHDNRTLHQAFEAQGLVVSGALKDNNLQYQANLAVRHQGGRLQQDESDHRLRISGADEVVLLLTAATNYRQAWPEYRGEHPAALLATRLKQAAGQSWQQLLDRHQQDYRQLFDRVRLDIGQQMPDVATPQLLAGYPASNTAAANRALEALYFQFGRYLLISSSRAGSLPANLQGVWNHSATPPWNADYHVNINLQMNYWLADLTNLSETNGPLFDFIDSLVEPGRIAARRLLGADGWTLFLNTNIWGFTGVIQWPTAFWQPEAGAWLAWHYWDHFQFTRDEEFLKQRAWPVIRGAADFWLDALVKDRRDGSLVVSPSYSPEHGDFTAGSAMSQQIVFDVLRNARDAATLVGDKAFARKVAKALEKLDPGLRIGSWGQLQEWKTDLDDPDNKHRHISHLFALHPGNQISINRNPEFLEAARVTLNGRGDGGTGWAQAWKVNMWARVHDGNRAHKVLSDQLQQSTLPNLWDSHPPFQIDGNFGATAGMVEMLLQSHNGELHILPALPQAWSNGAVKGLRARGNITVDLAWQQQQLQRLNLHAASGGEVQLRLPGAHPVVVTEEASGRAVTVQQEQQLIRFTAQQGKRYQLTVSNP